MTASTTITCTKSEFHNRLWAEYMSPIDHASRSGLEVADVINGLVKQANEHRGTFSGHSAYFDLDFTVTPDETKCADCDAPAVAISAVEPSLGTDTTPKPRCKRHALPQRQFCRVCQRSTVPAVTVETKGGTFHFCSDHTADAAVYGSKTMADYRPGAAVRRQLSELSYVSAVPLFKLVRMGIETECDEQGIQFNSDEVATWVVEHVADIVASRD